MKVERPRLKKVERESLAIVPEQIEKLKELFPEAVSEGKVDFDKLRQTLGDEVDAGPERYSFTWAGKRDCIKLLQVPSRATLIPSPDESIDWDTTNNVFIEGENLEVLKLLYKAYYGRVKMIYIDPPYNTGKDFIYPDNYADPLDTYLRLTGQKDAEGNVLTSNPETSGRYHSTWLSMMYPRLFVARQLLRDDGVIFVSIDDSEFHNLRAVLNDIFGEENFVANLVWQAKRGGGGGVSTIAGEHEYVLVYARQNAPAAVGKHQVNAEPLDLRDEKGPYRKGRELNKWGVGSARADRPTMYFPIPGPDGGDVYPIRNDGSEGRWRLGKRRMLEIATRGDAVFERRADGSYIVYEKVRESDTRYRAYRTLLNEAGTAADGTARLKDLFDGKSPFEFPKPVSLVEHLLRVGGTEEDDIVVDFFAGSCPIAEAVMDLNREDGGGRRFVVAQLPERTGREDYATIADIGKERIRRVIAKMKKEQEGKLATDEPQDLGFRVYKLAESNMKPWKGTDEKDPEKYAKTMEMFLDPLVEGWKPEDVIAEVALKEAGFGLNCRVEEVKPQMNADGRRLGSEPKPKTSVGVNRRASAVAPTVYRVTDEDKEQSFYICLDDKVGLEEVKFLNLTRDVLFVCRDVALDDETAANLALQCRLRTI